MDVYFALMFVGSILIIVLVIALAGSALMILGGILSWGLLCFLIKGLGTFDSREYLDAKTGTWEKMSRTSAFGGEILLLVAVCTALGTRIQVMSPYTFILDDLANNGALTFVANLTFMSLFGALYGWVMYLFGDHHFITIPMAVILYPVIAAMTVDAVRDINQTNRRIRVRANKLRQSAAQSFVYVRTGKLIYSVIATIFIVAAASVVAAYVLRRFKSRYEDSLQNKVSEIVQFYFREPGTGRIWRNENGHGRWVEEDEKLAGYLDRYQIRLQDCSLHENMPETLQIAVQGKKKV